MTAATKRGASTYGQVAGKLAGVDVIEIKVTIQDRQIDAVLSRYKLTIDNDEERFIYLFDTPSLDLFKAGMIARARRIVGEEDDSTVKFRPVVPYEVPKSWRRFAGFKLEADAVETGVVKSASLTMPVEKGLINQVVTGGKMLPRCSHRSRKTSWLPSANSTSTTTASAYLARYTLTAGNSRIRLVPGA